MKHLLFLIIFISLNINSEDNNHDHHHNEPKKNQKSLKAHEHGVSILNIAQDGDALLFEFEMPGFDVVGFEYKAKKKEDIKRIRNALNILSDYKNMIVLSDVAECKQKKGSSKVINEGTHSEFLSQYLVKCKNISQLKKLKVMYFSSFKYCKNLSINIVSKNKNISHFTDRDNSTINVSGYF